MVEASFSRMGTPPNSAGPLSMSLSRQLSTTRTLGNSALRSMAAMLRKYLMSNRTGAELAPRQPLALALRDDVGGGLHRHQQHDVVVDQDLRRAPAQPQPTGERDRLLVVAAPEEPHLAEIIERRHDLDPHGGSPAMRLLDLRVRELDEARVREHGRERGHEVRIGIFERGTVEARMRLELGIEVEIVVAQPLECTEIFVVIDGGDEPADLTEAVALRVVGEMAVVDQGVEDVGLADRDEMFPIAGGVRGPAIGLARCHGFGPLRAVRGPLGRTPSRRR